MHETASRALFEEEVAKFSPELLASRSWSLFSTQYPILDVGFSAADGARLRLRLLCDDWNERPPSVQFLDWEGRSLGQIARDSSGVFNNSAHPATGKPFACMKGVREYHTHPSHTGDAWETIRGGGKFTLGGILTQLWHVWKGLHK
jgi:Predicted metal binding domain